MGLRVGEAAEISLLFSTLSDALLLYTIASRMESNSLPVVALLSRPVITEMDIS